MMMTNALCKHDDMFFSESLINLLCRIKVLEENGDEDVYHNKCHNQREGEEIGESCGERESEREV